MLEIILVITFSGGQPQALGQFDLIEDCLSVAEQVVADYAPPSAAELRRAHLNIESPTNARATADARALLARPAAIDAVCYEAE